MKHIVISRKTQKKEFEKVNKNQDWFSDEKKREHWFNEYFNYTIDSLLEKFPDTLISVINDDIETIQGNRILITPKNLYK